jgi:hypothetical protein
VLRDGAIRCGLCPDNTEGTIQITESFGFLGSTYKSGPKKGQCNMSNSAPTVAQMGIVYGKGSVSF